MTLITTTPITDEYGAKLRLRFGYDPAIIAAIKQVQHRRYDPDTKTWTIPEGKLTELAGLLPDASFQPSVSHEQAVENVKEIGATVVNTPFPKELADEIRVLATRLNACADRLERFP